MIFDPRELGDATARDCDVCVVGSGAGGAAAAKELAEAGLRVAVLEAGPALAPEALGPTNRDDLGLYARRGAAWTEDFSVRLLSGRALGGSTVVGDAIFARPPAEVLTEWIANEGLAVAPEEFVERLRAMEKLFGVAPTRPPAINRNNALAMEGARRLGVEARALARAAEGGPRAEDDPARCVPEIRRNVRNTLVPLLDTYGAALYPGVAVERIVPGPEGVRIEARVEGGAALAWTARAAVVAAGALETPRLLARSGLAGGPRRTLHLSPTALVAGLMDAPVRAQVGAPATVEIDAWADWGGGKGPGVLVRGHGPHPAWLAPALGGVDAAAAMARFERLAVLEVVLRDRSRGTVAPDGTAAYALEGADARRMVGGVAAAAEVLLAAGAREVRTPIEGFARVGGAEDLSRLRSRRADPGAISLLATAPGGSCRVGPPERGGLLGPDFGVRGAPGVYVMDASALPTPVGVPPQLTILALAACGARRLARALQSRG